MLRPVVILITHQIVNLLLKTYLLNDKRKDMALLSCCTLWRTHVSFYTFFVYIIQECCHEISMEMTKYFFPVHIHSPHTPSPLLL